MRDSRSGQGGSAIAFIVAALLFVVILAVETQAFAEYVRYSGLLGKPLVGRWYAPTDTLLWMVRFDYGFDTATHVRPWVHGWFSAQRTQLSWAAGLDFVLFLVLNAALDLRWRSSDVHGAARWATGGDVRRSTLRKSKYGIILGQTKRPISKFGPFLIHAGHENVLGLGPPGTGKTDGIAVPTLLLGWPFWSAIVFDPAAELMPRTRDQRSRNTRVIVFDPRDPASARFNPLAGISVGDVDAVRAIMASFLLERDLGEMTEQERFFSGSALELGTALVLHSMELGAPTLAAAARYYYDPAWNNDSEFFESLLKSEVPYVAETGSKFGRMSEKQRSPIIATLTQQLDLFRTPDVARVTGWSDFHASDLRHRPCTLYLVVRERDQAALNPLMRMMLTRILDDLTSTIPAPDEQPVLLLIDEFPLLRAPVIQRKLATMRKYQIRSLLLAQTLSQIRAYYGNNEAISGLCDVRVFFPSVDIPTQDLASRTCGQATRLGETTSTDPRGGVGHSRHETGRPLLFPHELADIKASGEIVISVKGERPIRARPVRSHDDPRFTSQVR